MKRRYRRYTFLAPLIVVLEVLMDVSIPYVMSLLINNGIGKGDIGYVLRYGLLMVGLSIVSLLFGILSVRLGTMAGTGFSKGVRERLFHKVQDFSFASADRFSIASLVTRLTTDVGNVEMAFTMCLRMLVRSPVMLVSATAMALFMNARLAAVFLLAIPLIGFSFFYIILRAYPLFQQMLERMDGLNGRVQENLNAIRVVKALVREDYEIERFEQQAQDLKEAQIRAERLLIWNQPVMNLAMYACMIAISWFGGILIVQGQMETGDLMSFISYVTQILMSLMMLSRIFIVLITSRASAMRIVEVLDTPVDLNDDAADPALAPQDGSIVFEGVGFGYYGEERLILNDINLSIRAGETVGIIGGTGSAKSTLVQLIPRLYDVQRGRVLVGGHDVRDYKFETLRGAVAMVLQKNVLFSGSVRENLRWGNEQATDEELEAACRAAQAHDFVTELPQGYDTELGQGGVNLSGGQRQRLCIARALLCKPKILILDDSTSAVDTLTDSRLRAALSERHQGVTTLIIAQRISSLTNADRIVVMEGGRIEAVGTHEQLLESSAIYREVYETQLKGVA
ncbi:MAG: ABC transporter ATP-binding protein [Clostridiales bacterium]|nr:ABC transporter ATP-binding protein [Clostridiales bacterium]